MTFLEHILGGDDRLVKENNPADIAIRNKEHLGDLTLWLFTGTKDVALEDSQWAHQFLESNHIAHRFEISKDVGHALKRHFELFGDEIFRMLGEKFAASEAFAEQPKAADVGAMTPVAVARPGGSRPGGPGIARIRPRRAGSLPGAASNSWSTTRRWTPSSRRGRFMRKRSRLGMRPGWRGR